MACALLFLDLWTKHGFYNLQWFSSDFLTPVFNPGISWGIVLPQYLLWFFSLVALLLFAWMYRRKQITRWMFALLLA
ncbi:MAG: signal peptidase II [bacterium]|nr:signal peptidase II [bacterium]